MTPRNTRRIKIAAWARGSRNLRSLGYTPPLSEWAYNPGMVLSGPETAQGATTTGNAATATGGGNWGAQTGDFGASVHTHGLDDYTCRERLVGECVIEREVAEAVAREREAIAGWLESIISTDWTAHWTSFEPPITAIAMHVLGDANSPLRIIAAIRSGAHNEGVRHGSR